MPQKRTRSPGPTTSGMIRERAASSPAWVGRAGRTAPGVSGKVESHQDPWPAVTAGIGLDQASEARRLEHGHEAHIPKGSVDSTGARLHRVGLERGRPSPANVRDGAFEERARDAAA